MEGEKAGIGAARYVREGLAPAKQIYFRGGRNVRYVVPQVADPTGEEGITVSFRVSNIERNVRAHISVDGRKLKSRKFRIVLPSEMIRIDMDPKILSTITPGSEVEVAVEGEAV